MMRPTSALDIAYIALASVSYAAQTETPEPMFYRTDLCACSLILGLLDVIQHTFIKVLQICRDLLRSSPSCLQDHPADFLCC